MLAMQRAIRPNQMTFDLLASHLDGRKALTDATRWNARTPGIKRSELTSYFLQPKLTTC